MTDEKIQLVITAKDMASQDVKNLTKSLGDLGSEAQGTSGKLGGLSNKLDGISGHLLGVTKDARMLHRETYGVRAFASALDTVAGTSFTGLIGDITTVAEIAQPLKDLGTSIVNSLEGALGSLKTKIGSALSSAWESVSNAPVLGTAIDKAGTVMGGKLGSAIKGAGALGIAAGVALAFDDLNAQLDAKVKTMGADQAKVYSGSFGQKVLSGIDQFLTANDLRGLFGPQFQNVLDDLDHMAVEGATTAGANAGDAFSTSFASHAGQDIVNLGPTGTQFGWTATTASLIASEFADQFNTDLGKNMDAASNRLADVIGGPLKSSMMVATTKAAAASAQAGADELANKAIWDKSAMAIGGDITAALYDSKNSVRKAMQSLMKAELDPMKQARKEQHIQAALNSKQLATDLNSQNPYIRQKALQTQQYLIGLWEYISGSPYPAQAADNLKTGLASTYPAIKTQAKAFVNQYNDILAGLKTSYHVNVDVARGIAGKVSHLPTFASGGNPTPGVPSLVGEKGPEVVTFGHNAHVWPSGTGPAAAHTHDIYIDGRKVMKAVDPHLGMAMARTSSAAFTRG